MMKIKWIAILLVMVLVSGMLAGCTEETPFTPTDAKDAVAFEQEQQEKQQQESTVSQSEKEIDKEQKEDEPVSSATEKEPEKQTAATSSKAEQVSNNKQEKEDSQTVSSTAPAGNSGNGTAADAMEEIPPSFTSVAGYHSWLQNGGIEEDVRAELLSNVDKLTTYTSTRYTRPKLGDGNQMFTLSEIVTPSYGAIYWYVASNANKSDVKLKISIYTDPLSEGFLQDEMEKRYAQINSVDRVFDQYGEATVNGITYYYYHSSKKDVTIIYWQVNGNTFYAMYYGEYSQIKQILPMLELEQVEYKVSDQAVK